MMSHQGDGKRALWDFVMFAVIGCFCSQQATATVVTPAAAVTVTVSYAYTSYLGGDFVFSTSDNAPGCYSGWYIKSSDPGFKAAVAAVLTAQAAGSYIVVYGDNADIWPGSGGQYCRVQTVGLKS
jgi:hypothetical protein